MANSVDPDQTAPSGAVWSGSALFAYTTLSDTLVYEILVHLPFPKYLSILIPYHTCPKFEQVHFSTCWCLNYPLSCWAWIYPAFANCRSRSVKKPTDVDLHCLPLSMRIYINNLDQVIWLAENLKRAWHLNFFSRTRVKLLDLLHIYVDPDQMLQYLASDLGLNCMLRPVFSSSLDKYSM